MVLTAACIAGAAAVCKVVLLCMPLLLFGFFLVIFVKTAKFWVGHGLAQVLYTPVTFKWSLLLKFRCVYCVQSMDKSALQIF